MVGRRKGTSNAQHALWASTSMSTRGGIATFVRNMRDTALWQDWNIHHVATHCNGSTLARGRKFATGYWQYLRELTFERPDIVHVHTASNGSFARKCILTWTAKAFRIPVVIHVHGGLFHQFFDGAPVPIRLLIRATLQRADAVIALGNSWAAELQRIAPGASIDVVPNGIRPKGLNQKTAPSPVRVVFLGGVGELKGTFVLLAGWAKLMSHVSASQAILTIVGEGDTDRARHLIDELGIGTSVELRGWITESEVSSLLDKSQLLVLASLNEGQPMAILEAMARGMCIVATAVGGIPDMLGVSGGVLVDPGDADALADALSAVLTDDQARSRYGAAALKRAEQELNVDSAAARIDHLYRHILQRRNVRDSGTAATDVGYSGNSL